MTKSVLALLLAALVLVSVRPSRAAAQQGETQPGRVPVTIVLLDRGADAEPFTLQRRADQAPHDVIILRPQHANRWTLSAAVEDLLVSRAILGDTVSEPVMVRLRRPRGAAGDRRLVPWAEQVIRDLRQAAPREVPGIGVVRAVEIWLPPRGKGSVEA